jgi:predicted TIM-barrel fold metal-dependent hydrolase
MSRTIRFSFLAVLAGVVGSAQPRTQSVESAQAHRSVSVAADHHLHIRTATLAAVLDELAALPGATAPPGPRASITAGELIEALDAAGVQRGVVLSNAYMFGAPDIEVQEEYAKVRTENDYVAAQVARYPDRLVGAFSLNPLADYALDEIERCSADARLAAIKLHLTNSRVDLRNAEHVERLAGVFEELGRRDIPAIVHLRTSNPEYGATDAQIFIDEVLPQAPGLPVQIAHMAGWGGYDDATDAALGAFATAFDEGHLDRDFYTFDLGAVVFLPAAAGAGTALERQVTEANERLAARIREIGLDRIVYATDWPAWPPIANMRKGIERNLELIEAALPLSDEEWARILSNTGPVLNRGR